MEESRSPKLVIFSGPATSGKSTTIDELLKCRPVLRKVLSSTCRPPRKKKNGEMEMHEVDYNFYSCNAIQYRISGGYFAEYDEYDGHTYGVEFQSIEAASLGGMIPIKDVTLPGARNILRLFPNARLLFLRPPSFADLERRLREERNSPEETIRYRLARARREVEEGPRICHHVIDSIDGRISDIVVPKVLEIIDPFLSEIAA